MNKVVGKFFGVSVGPGDPEHMTIKAINTIKQADVIAFSGKNVKEAVAYNIASQTVPEISDKTLLMLEMPMSKDRERIAEAHKQAAVKIKELLVAGKDVAFLVLGDATIYSTFMYLMEIVSKEGFDTQVISGVTSFCAAAAITDTALCQWNEELIIVPTSHQIPKKFEDGKNYILMKAGNNLVDIRERIIESNRDAVCVENCGMTDEKVYQGVHNIPDSAGYYTIVIVK